MNDFSLLSLLPSISISNNSSAENITLFFVCFLFAVFMIFFGWAVSQYRQSRSRVNLLKNELDGLNTPNLPSKRREILNSLNNSSEECGKLWREFDESLVETHDSLRNTLDAEHFFNTFTLSRGLTDNRLLAAVPGFLTAIGVIGTFCGLSLGLSGLETEGTTEELRAGISSVINGASIAFMTSVWGVLLSVLFNFGEKMLERTIRSRIAELQNQIDFLFPRITAEQSLVQIAAHNKNTDEAIQEMAEKIGNKMQEAMVEVSDSINSNLQAALTEALAPAIEKLVSNANGGAQNALDGLLERFLDKMGDAGESQKVMMERASEDVNKAVSGLSSEISGFVDQVKQQNTELGATLSGQFEQVDQREQDRNNALNKQLNEMAARSQQIMNQLGSSLNDQLSSHKETTESQNKAFNDSLTGLQDNQNTLTDRVSQLLNDHQSQANQIMSGLSELETKLSTMADANEKAASSLHNASSELKTGTNQLGLMAANVKEAANSLGEMNEGATKALNVITDEHKLLIQQSESLNKRFENIQSQMGVVSEDLIKATTLAESGFKAVDQNMNKFISDMTEQVSKLDAQTADLMSDFASSVSGQTRERLNQWNEQTNEFTSTMKSAIESISQVVDEIEGKVEVA